MKFLGAERERMNFGLYLSGRSISVLVSSVYTFAVSLYVLRITGSGLSFAVTLVLQILPTVLLGPFAGALADKFNKKFMIVITDALSGFVFIILYVVSPNGLTLSSIYIAILLSSVLQTLYNICLDAVIPDIVSTDHILRLNSVSKIIDSTASIISPGIGGFFYSFIDMRFFILLNGIAFLVSALSECLIDYKLYKIPVAQVIKTNMIHDISDGIQYIRKSDWLKAYLLNFLILNFFMAFCYSVPLPYILNQYYKLSPNHFGIIQCFMPVGVIIGALLINKILKYICYERLMILSGFVVSVSMFFIGVLPLFRFATGVFTIILYYGFFLFVLGEIIALVDIPFMNSFQVRVPDAIRGRALSISMSIIKIITPISYLISGVLLAIVPAFSLPLGGSAALLIAYILLQRFTRKMG